MPEYHAKKSPSASKRWMTCPGSIRLTDQLDAKGLIKKSSNKYTAEGTVAHDIHEHCLLENTDADKYLGMTLQAEGFKFKVNQNMVDAVQTSLDYIRQTIEDLESEGYTVHLEVEVWSDLSYLKIPGLDGGTSDVVLKVYDGENLVAIIVIDYKHGQGVAVEPENNTQALHYALGVYHSTGRPSTLKEVQVTISQPRAHHSRGPIRSWNIDASELVEWESEDLIPAAKACDEPNAPLVPSDEGCRFCPAAPHCTALYNKTQEVAMVDFAADTELAVFPDIETLTSEQKMLVMDHATAFRSFIVAVEEQIRNEVDQGSQEYEGRYKLVRKTTRRSLTEDATDPITSPLLDYMDEEEMFKQTPRTLGELETTLKNKLKAENVKGFTKIAKEIMDDITTKPEGSLVIAPYSDKRQAVQPSLIGDFDNLD